MKFFSFLAAVVPAPGTRLAAPDAGRWLSDPLSHPALEAMTERELGDMPFRLTARRTEREMAPPSCR